MEIGKESFDARDIKTGHATVGLVPVRLTELGDIRAIKGITVRASKDNTATVYVGGVGVSSDTGKRVGMILAAGESWAFPADNPYHIWVVSSDDGQIVFWAAG